MHLPTERNNLGWYEDVRSYQIISKKQAEVVLLGDSSRYPIVWDHHLENLNVVNCGIRGDHTQNVLCRVEYMYLPATVSVGLIHCGINDISSTSANAYRPHEINVILCGFKLREGHLLISIVCFFGVFLIFFYQLSS